MSESNTNYIFFVDKINERFPGLSKLIEQVRNTFHNVHVINDLDGIDDAKEIIPLGTVAANFYLKKYKKGEVAFIIDAYSLGFYSVSKFYLKIRMYFNKHLIGAILRYFKYYLIEKKIVKNFKKIIVVSEHDAKYLNNKFNCYNVEVVSNGADYPDLSFRKKKEFDYTMGILAYWGASSIRDVNWFIEDYFPRLKQIYPKIKLVTAGRGASPEIVNYFKMNGVTYLGEIENLWDLFNNIDIYITTLRKECGILNKVLDAMAHKKIVVGLQHNLLAFQNLKNGFLTYNTFDELVEAIEKIKNDEKLVKSIETTAYNYIQLHHNWSNNYEKFKEIIDAHFKDSK
jgi:glycosyltransferase involved in cell wall biosynthesis